MHSELRMHPRMPTKLPAEMILSEDVSVDVIILNLSVGGMLIEGSDQMFHAVQAHKPAFPIEVEIYFGLQALPVRSHCRLIHTVRKRQDLYQMGFKALSMDEQSSHLIRQTLDDYTLTREL